MNDSFTKEQVLNAYNIAPDFVRAAFNDGETTQVIVELQAKFQLHIDQAGMLGKEVGYLLLGLVDPSRFVGRLKNNGLSEQAANGIVAEINQKIFVPLREQMRSGAAAAPQQTKPTVPPAVSQPMARAPLPPTSAQPPHYFHLENKLPPPPPRQGSQTPAPTSPEATKGTATPPSALAGALKQVLHKENQAPLLQKPVNDEKLLEDHEEPHINIGVSDKVQGASLPGTQPPIPATSSAPLKPSTLPLTPSPIPAAPKSYSSDPYREPIDEK